MTRTILITGATGDIAQSLIKRLPAQDMLILLTRDKEKLAPLYSQQINVQVVNNADYQDLADLPIDILINNAGFGIFANLAEQTDNQIDDQFEVNTLFPIKLIQTLKPRQQVINICSIAGLVPSAKSTIYAASKAALITFSDALRIEEPNLIVTTVNTGPVKTKFHATNQTYLKKVGRTAVTADYVAKKLVKIIGKKKRQLNLPWTMALIAKLRAIAPALIDFMGVHFFNYK